jgi:glycosyltransferase involved in cell wall biosynthesis
MPKTLTVLTPCFNEEPNVRELYLRVRAAIAIAGNYQYEHIFIDNASTDNTLGELKAIAAKDRNVKVIRNTRNFGHIRSPMHALYQASGDAVIGIVADLQDPPEMIVDMIHKWEEGYPVVICVKAASDENGLMFWIRKKYYKLVKRLSGVETYENFTGFGLYDRKVVEIIKASNDPYPYFRGMIAEAGFRHFDIPYPSAGAQTRNHQKQFLFALRHGDARDHQPVQGATATGDLFRFCGRAGFDSGVAGIPPIQIDLLESLLRWHRAIGHRSIFLHVGPNALYGHYWGIHRHHPYPGAEPAAGGRAGEDQLRIWHE